MLCSHTHTHTHTPHTPLTSPTATHSAAATAVHPHPRHPPAARSPRARWLLSHCVRDGSPVIACAMALHPAQDSPSLIHALENRRILKGLPLRFKGKKSVGGFSIHASADSQGPNPPAASAGASPRGRRPPSTAGRPRRRAAAVERAEIEPQPPQPPQSPRSAQPPQSPQSPQPPQPSQSPRRTDGRAGGPSAVRGRTRV